MWDSGIHRDHNIDETGRLKRATAPLESRKGSRSLVPYRQVCMYFIRLHLSSNTVWEITVLAQPAQLNVACVCCKRRVGEGRHIRDVLHPAIASLHRRHQPQ